MDLENFSLSLSGSLVFFFCNLFEHSWENVGWKERNQIKLRSGQEKNSSENCNMCAHIENALFLPKQV